VHFGLQVASVSLFEMTILGRPVGWPGERLDLHRAIWICFANAKNQAARREREHALAN
jgi:hypothetical protein